MAVKWDNLEGGDAAERIIRAAISAEASEIHCTSDAEGATLFFISPERIEFFDHIPPGCCEMVHQYLRSMAAIDNWVPPPARGVGVFVWDGDTYSLEINLLKGGHGEDIKVTISAD